MSCTENEAHVRLDAALHGTAYQGPTSYWLELVTSTPTTTAAGTASGLDRIELVCSTGITNAGDGTGVNAADWVWDAPVTDLDECTYIELWRSESSTTEADRAFYEMLTTPVTPLGGQDVTIPAGQFTWTEV
jgi:hypothetical protein